MYQQVYVLKVYLFLPAVLYLKYVLNRWMVTYKIYNICLLQLHFLYESILLL